MSDSVERIRRRQELRRSNAAVRHRNRYREHKAGQDGADWLAEFEQERDHLEPRELECDERRTPGR